MGKASKNNHERLRDLTVKALSGAPLTRAERRQFRKLRGKQGEFEWRLLGGQRKDRKGRVVLPRDQLTINIINGHQESRD